MTLKLKIEKGIPIPPDNRRKITSAAEVTAAWKEATMLDADAARLRSVGASAVRASAAAIEAWRRFNAIAAGYVIGARSQGKTP